MEITKELVAKLEDLCQFELSDEERERISADLQNAVSEFAKLGELDTTGIAERSHAFDNVNALREDEVRSSFERELILQNAPARNEDSFSAPSVMEGN